MEAIHLKTIPFPKVCYIKQYTALRWIPMDLFGLEHQMD